MQPDRVISFSTVLPLIRMSCRVASSSRILRCPYLPRASSKISLIKVLRAIFVSTEYFCFVVTGSKPSFP